MKKTDVNNPRGQFALTNGRVILSTEIVLGKAVVVDKGIILGIASLDELGVEMEKIDVGGRYITPGLIDIHTHGALGYSFNHPTVEDFTAITNEIGSRGITSLLATVATAPIPDLIRCLDFTRSWISEQHSGAQIIGVHLEGPYFCIEQRGAQDPENLRTPDDGTVDLLLEHHDVIKIMSYAPELPGALTLTEKLDRLGVVPAAGHSCAKEDDIRAAMVAGLRHIIHIWSGQSTTIREGPWRKPGLLEASLVYDGLTVEMIADNRHLPPTLMKLAYKCIGADNLCIISDATSGAGLPVDTRFGMGNMSYKVGDGVGMTLDNKSFAGSTTLINEMIPILTQTVGIPLIEAIRMTSLNPARVIGLDYCKGSLIAGMDADLAIFENDFSAWRTMRGGHWI
jgi:N-acetylglucosamine-6-phosphate deacetylase